MKTAELIGPDLDAWVSRAERHTIEKLPNGKHRVTGDDRDAPGMLTVFLGYLDDCAQPWSPSTLAAQGQPIMERERIGVAPSYNLQHGECWVAAVGLGASLSHGESVLEGQDDEAPVAGPTMLIAGMRARVAQVYGDEVPG